MSYQKPVIVAKSGAKQSYVAGCPEEWIHFPFCHRENWNCSCGPLS